MRPLDKDEAAVTTSNFRCEVEISCRTTERGAQRDAQVEAVTVKVGLSLIVWLPVRGNTPKLTAHEEGHKQIAQMCYEEARRVARDAAAPLIGRRYDFSGIDERESSRIINEAAQEACRRYMSGIAEWSAQVNQEYDKITDHGRNPVGEQDAVKQAFETVERQRLADAASPAQEATQ
jgi:hypothetical protein